MKGFIKRCSVVSCVVCLLLTGCGDSLYTLTTEEEEMISTYSSGAVAKANKKQTQGMLYVIPEEAEELGNLDEDTGEEPANDADVSVPTDAGTANGADTGVLADTESAGKNASTLTEALNMDGIEAIYKGHQISNTYTEGNYAALEALEGYTYIILDITLSNRTAEPITCNIFTANPSCQLITNGETKATALSTILLNDFATYMEPIDGGASEETVLIFQVKTEEAENIEALALAFGIGGNDYYIALE